MFKRECDTFMAVLICVRFHEIIPIISDCSLRYNA